MPAARLMAVCLALVADLCALPDAAAAQGRVRERTYAIPDQPLSTALTALARQADIEIVFAGHVIGQRLSLPLRGRMTVDKALSTLLAGSGLSFRRTPDGTYVIGPGMSRKEGESRPSAAPEILVVGRRTQNADIRRREEDARPYQVYTAHDIRQAQAETVDAFVRTRLPANAQIAAPAQDIAGGLGSTRSAIDLRGLGENQTLVLVDGRRMPNVPRTPYSFNQPDVNGVPIGLIDRIEVLTATAGGVYGNGATSGVINIILKRDYHGLEQSLAGGITTRGDVPTYRYHARLGFTPDHGATHVMLGIGVAGSGTLRDRQRDYQARARARRFSNDPVGFIAGKPAGNGINIFGTDPLTLKPAWGGNALGANITFLPLDLSGDPVERTRLLTANAGRIALAPSPSDATSTIVAQARTRSLLANVRHEFGGGWEAFLDILAARNTGLSASRSGGTAQNVLNADSPNNPFEQAIVLAVPLPGYGAVLLNRTETTRIVTGLLVPLPGSWRGDVEYSGGAARVAIHARTTSTSPAFNSAFAAGRPRPGLPALSPLDNWAAFAKAIPAYKFDTDLQIRRENRFRDAAVRLAGPIARLPTGEVELTLLAEQRQETTPASTLNLLVGDAASAAGFPRISQRTRSVYGEARMPLAAGRRGTTPDLEAQLAVRADWTRTVLPSEVNVIMPGNSVVTARDATTSYTGGVKWRPVTGLLLRGSIATGGLPPSTDQIGTTAVNPTSGPPDPQRGGRLLGSEQLLRELSGGSAALLPEQARSVSFGMILSPWGNGGPRLTVDLTRIDKRHEIVPFPFDSAGLLARESLFPDRITRAPLTPADQALGFTAGPVTRLDLTALNVGRTRIDAVDMRLDSQLRTVRRGVFHWYLNGTWEPRFRQRLAAGNGWIERVGYSDGPLAVRGNLGVDWSFGAFSAGLNGQFYSRYRVIRAFSRTSQNPSLSLGQGRALIPAQAYIDMSAAYAVPTNGTMLPRGTEIRFGVINLLDHRPPIVTDDTTPGYSYYGDPRRRRVELMITVPFGT